MNILIDDLESLAYEEMVSIEGGKLDRSFGGDVGYVLGWLLSAMGKGASAIQG
ncbi:hypothetical protein [Dyadobacter sp. LHD-138]|uniref:hypothetical protein n=1 Tax=Dyadobacter sp. LHD-138 TaxID=3071413 RepID=UPI0027E15079|nr:hypothetical protein [Dyadobacter sp. LHD-138]MDQ6477420.1 hypothetical protein [Dyadobacter sp. LHD-138]